MIQNHEKMKQIAQSIRFATIQELKDGYDESTDELVVITPKCHNVTFQVNEQVNNQEIVAVVNENCLLLDVQEPEFDHIYDAVSNLEDTYTCNDSYQDQRTQSEGYTKKSLQRYYEHREQVYHLRKRKKKRYCGRIKVMSPHSNGVTRRFLPKDYVNKKKQYKSATLKIRIGSTRKTLLISRFTNG